MEVFVCVKNPLRIEECEFLQKSPVPLRLLWGTKDLCEGQLGDVAFIKRVEERVLIE